MNRYKTSTPRAAVGLISVAMAAITTFVLVALPAMMEDPSFDPPAVVTAKAAAGSAGHAAGKPL